MNAPASTLSFTLQQVLTALQAEGVAARLHGDAQAVWQRVHTDSRTVQPGDLFVALRGARFDAHDFLPQVQQQGAIAALVAAGKPLPAGLNAIEVPQDTLHAMSAWARHWRRQWVGGLIAVTGSNGKTTVTQMLAAILRAECGAAALATQGNLNNEIGVPMMTLRLRPQHRLAVLELGMNHPGEIAHLAQIAQPTVALVNNAQREHLEFMHTIDAVARENGSVFAALPADGVAIFPGDDAFTPLWRELAAGRPVLTFGGSADCQVQLRKAQWGATGWQAQVQTPQGVLDVAVPMLGRHNLRNALAAVACAVAAGVSPQSIVQGLRDFQPVQGRSAFELRQSADGALRYLIDDSYNANPDSVKAAIEVLADLPAPRTLVLGDMGEVGDQGEQFHAEAGEYAKARGIDHLLALGAASVAAVAAFGDGAQHFDDMPALQAQMEQTMQTHTSVLIKGSRFMGMERAVQRARECTQPAAQESIA